ncbi:MAG: HAD family hydrolase [Candidatus Hodarchaeales archaeon]
MSLISDSNSKNIEIYEEETNSYQKIKSIKSNEFESSQFNAVVFDFDGTLANSFQLFIEMLYRELVKRNPKIDYNELVDICRQMVFQEIDQGRYKDPKKLLLKIFYKASRYYGLKPAKAGYITMASALRVQKNYNEIEIFSPAEELLKFLHSEGIPSILITMSSKKKVIEILRKNNLDTYFHIILDRNDLKNLETDDSLDKVTGIQQALAALGLEAADTIVIGDLPTDITDGKTVGAKTAAVTTGPVPKEKLADQEPDFIFSDLSDFLAIFKRSVG